MQTPKATFLLSALKPAQFPGQDLPELAFAGRSNVGKSSLINSLLGQRQLARVSSTPGRTQAINFFHVEPAWIFVDLPGYGYAKVPDAVRASWRGLIEAYLVQRTPLQGIILIVDIRREPMASDLQLKDFLLAQGIPLLLVATKVDKLSRQQAHKKIGELGRAFAIPRGLIIGYSSLTGAGREELWREIRALMIEGAAEMKELRKEFEARNLARKRGEWTGETDASVSIARDPGEEDAAPPGHEPGTAVVTREDGSW